MFESLFKKIIYLGALSLVIVSFVTPATVIALSTAAPTRVVSANLISTPTHISIPNAKVNANIIEVGITPTGNLDVPNNYIDVGWYKYGPLPGQMGSAVLDGHVDNGGKIPGPFKHLRKLKVGDSIFVTMGDGKVHEYKTIASEVYATENFPGRKVFLETGKEYLKIITCHGKFIPSLDTYDERLIVTAVLVGTSHAI